MLACVCIVLKKNVDIDCLVESLHCFSRTLRENQKLLRNARRPKAMNFFLPLVSCLRFSTREKKICHLKKKNIIK